MKGDYYNMNEENKKYLKWYQKLGYGQGDFGANCFYVFVTNFVLIYLTDTVGLNAGIIGTLILVSKCFDGISDVIFGKMIDKTNHKLGKARPWILFSTLPIAIFEVLMFTVPSGLSQGMQYVYFFIIYTASNAIFYTANNISYATLMALITKNKNERVQITSYRYIFAMIANIIISAVSMGMVNAFGGGVSGWRTTSLIFAVLQIFSNIILVLSAKEIPENTKNEGDEQKTETIKENDKLSDSFGNTLKAVMTNKYYILMLTNTILGYISQGIMGALGIYYCTYVLGNSALLGVLSMAQLAMAIGLLGTPAVVRKMGIYRAVTVFFAISAGFSVLAAVAGFRSSFLLLVVAIALKYLTFAPSSGCSNPLIAEIATNVYLKKNIHAEGVIFSCSSVGIKVGGGLASAISGWALVAVRYNASLDQQTQFTLNGITAVYLLVPAIISIISAIIIRQIKVIQENQKLMEKSKI